MAACQGRVFAITAGNTQLIKQDERNMRISSEIYTIHVKGKLDAGWAEWFDDMTISYRDGDTIISGPVADQAALHGLLAKIRDLGLLLIDVRREGQ